MEGDRLVLDAESAFATTRPRVRGVLSLDKHPGHADPAKNGNGGDPAITAWLSYNPKFDLVKPAPASPHDMSKGLAREAAAKADPRVGEDATGDLDGGVYNVQHTQVGALAGWRLEGFLCVQGTSFHQGSVAR